MAWCLIFREKIVTKYKGKDMVLMFGSRDDTWSTMIRTSEKLGNEALNCKNEQEMIYDLRLIIRAKWSDWYVIPIAFFKSTLEKKNDLYVYYFHHMTKLSKFCCI